MQFLGIRWDNNTKEPSIKYKQHPNEGVEFYYPLNHLENITIRVSKDRHCIGYYQPPDYQRAQCQDNARMQDTGKFQCTKCRAFDATHFLPVDTISPDQIKELKSLKYYNYINLFGHDIVKIGVAADARKFTRLLEQGAFATIIFAEGDGYNTRKVEDYVSRALKIRQAVSWSTKIKLMRNVSSTEQSQTILNTYYDDIREILTKHFSGGVRLMHEYYFHLDKYHLPLSHALENVLYIDNVSENDVLSGKIVGMYGEVLLLQNKENILAVNTKALLGYSIELARSANQVVDLSTSIKYKRIGFEDKKTQDGSLF